MPVTAGSAMTLVASSRPPKPTSTIVAAAGVRAKARKAAAVVTSKKLGRISPALSSTSLNSAASASSSISVPASLIRSLKRTRCGLE